MIFIIAVLFSGYFGILNFNGNYYHIGISFVEFLLIGLLGWAVYGPAVKP